MKVLSMVLSIRIAAHIAMTIRSPVYPVLAYDVGQEEENTNIFKKVILYMVLYNVFQLFSCITSFFCTKVCIV